VDKTYYQLLANSTFEGVCIHENGVILHANERFFELFQYTEDELINTQVMPLLLTPESLKVSEQNIIDETTEPYEVECIKKDGTIFPAEALPRNAVLNGRKVRGIAIRDITEFKKQKKVLEEAVINTEKLMREKEEYFKLLADASFEGILIHDKGVVINANNRMEEMYGYTKEEIIGKYLMPMVIAPDSLETAMEHVRLNMMEPYEINCIKKDGTIFPVEILPSQNEYNGKVVRVLALRDMTRIKEYQESLIEAKEAAERANRAKSQFLSSVSHELRTPLNAIIGFAQLFQMIEDVPDDIKIGTEEILNGGMHLLDLVNDIIDLARIESGDMVLTLTPVNMGNMLNECAALVENYARENGITITLNFCDSLNEHVFADRIRLKQIILNILSNSIKYNRKNGDVQISCETRDDSILVKVSDNGAGLSENQLANLFQPFNRLGAENSRIEGTGIGLVLTRKLLEAMNGNIGVDSKLDSGTTVWFSLPTSTNIDADTSRLKDKEIIRMTASPSRYILYIEDNISNQKLMKSVVKNVDNIELSIADSAEEALESIEKKIPDLILLDIDLPGINGYELFERLQADSSLKNIPVIAVTASAMTTDLEKADKVNFAAYLTKPLIIDKLFRSINSALNQGL